MTHNVISQGAEAKIFLIGDRVLKDRVVKTYRHPQIDLKIRKRRTKSEIKIIKKAAAAEIKVPEIFSDSKDAQIHMEYIRGDRLCETLNSYEKKKQWQVMKKVGCQVAKLHSNDIIHGDLTTSNMILSGEDLYIIDFGLGYISNRVEDMAVDLHLIRQALEAKHFERWEELFENFLEGYKWKDSDKVTKRLYIVERRGRYKRSEKNG